MSSFDSVENDSCSPPDITETAKEATADLLPDKSKKVYEICYGRFIAWCDVKFVKNIIENVLLAYLKEKSEVLKSSRLWSVFHEHAMLKATPLLNKNVEIRHFTKLIPFFIKFLIFFLISKKTKIATQILEGEPSTSTGNFTTVRRRLSEEAETSTSKSENKIQNWK